jgi:SAM-dependent methyltransferase
VTSNEPIVGAEPAAALEPAATDPGPLADRLLADAVSTMELLSVALGAELGLYQAVAEGATDARTVAQRAGIHPRYAREWLEQQAVAGVLQAEPGQDPDPYARVFALPEPHRQVLLDPDSPAFLGTLPGLVASFGGLLPELAAAYRTGGGVAYQAYGPATRHGIAGMNRPMFHAQLGDWLATLPDIRDRLASQPGRVLDLGCGTGASSIALAELFPPARVDGVDLDQASIAEAEAAARRAGLAGRVSFRQADAAGLTGPAGGSYQLVTLFESLHDIADPVAALRAARALLAPGGAVLIGDERVAERFTAPGDLVERLNYGFSVLHCLPATRAEGTAVEAGTVLRPDTVAEYAARAGYTTTVLPVGHDLWRFYRLDPA